MKKMIAILSIVSISSTSFATTCISGNLQEDIQKIQSLNLSQASKAMLIGESKSAKVSEIVACSATRELITREDSAFATMQLNLERALDIKKIDQEAQYLASLLSDSSLNEGLRQVYQQMLKETPQRIKEKNIFVDTVISNIKQRTKN